MPACFSEFTRYISGDFDISNSELILLVQIMPIASTKFIQGYSDQKSTTNHEDFAHLFKKP